MKTVHKIFLKTFAKHLLTILIPVVLLGTLSFSISYQYVYETAAVSSEQSLEQLKRYMDQNATHCDSFERFVNPDTYSSPSLKHIFLKDKLEFGDAIRLPIFMSLINSLVNTNADIESIYVYWPNEQNKILVSNRGLLFPEMLSDSEWQTGYQEAIEVSRQNHIAKRILPIKNEQDLPVLTFFHKIHSLDHAFSRGMVITNFRVQAIQNHMENLKLYPSHQLYLIHEDGQVLTGTSPENPAGYDHNQNTISVLEDKDLGVQYLSVIPNHQLYSVPQKLFRLTALLTVLSLFLSAILAGLYSRNTSRNVNAIFDIFSAAQDGRPLPSMPTTHDEYNYIISNLISTFLQQDYLKIQLSEKIYRERTLELIALQTQINPHFLFNTLETIHMCAFGLTSGSSNSVTYLLENLSRIMRYTLSDPDKPTSFKEELEYAKSYINIQKFRYKDKFHVIWEYEDDILDVPVIKLLLQPIIENSISHGLKPSPKPGLIKIKVFCRNGCFALHIVDTGIGMTKERLKELRTSLANSSQSYEHIGIHNIYKRLKLIYGEKAEFCIHSKYHHGTAITIRFPFSVNDMKNN